MAIMHKGAISLTSLLVVFLISSPLHAANWLLLQGTEKPSASERAKVWGFVQAQYQHDLSSGNNDKYTPAKLIGPNLTSQAMFNVNRARIGIRGTGMPIDSKLNYLLLTEFGNSGVTQAGQRVKVTDSSITSQHIPFFKMRFGLFKYPGSEEGLQAIHVSDYINFSTVSNQLMLERFPNNDNYVKKIDTNNKELANTDAQLLSNSANGFEQPVGAYRDVGVQIFDSFQMSDWEHSYAFMIGNGNGLNFGDNNTNKTTYYYASSEKIFTGTGGRRQGIKFYGWYQTGLRAYDTDFSFSQTAIDDTTSPVFISSGKTNYLHFKRTRMGTGFKYLRNGIRVAGEYMSGEGMIFVGSHKESFDMNQYGSDDGGYGILGKANGWYLDAGWHIPGTRFEFDFRYDRYNRLTGDNLEVNYSTITVGAQYFINKKARFTVNYAVRSAKSKNNIASLENNFADLGGRIAAQITAVY